MRTGARARFLRWSAAPLLAAVLAGAAAPHRHLGGEEEAPARSSETLVLTSHDAHSRDAHWHRILRIVESDPCWACRLHRRAFLPPTAAALRALEARGATDSLPARAAVSVARFTRLSRGPPVLL